MAKVAEDAKWRAESDAETLVRANEIKQDPKRMEAAQKILNERLVATKQTLSFDMSDEGKKMIKELVEKEKKAN